MPTINGTSAATLNRQDVSFTPNQGAQWGGRYEGPLVAITAIYNLLQSTGYEVHLDVDSSPIASLTFRSSFQSGVPGTPTDPNSDFQDTWELVRNTVQKELMASDHPLIAALDATVLGELKGFMNDPSSFDNEAGAENFTGADPNALYLFDLWQSGVRSVEIKQPILRLTRITNPLYDSPYDTSLVDVVLSTSSMIANSGVPSNFAVPLLALADALTGTVTRNDSLELNFGWLKDLISATKTGSTRVQYVTEWKFGLYDEGLYGAPA